jgi:hypothetical protein
VVFLLAKFGNLRPAQVRPFFFGWAHDMPFQQLVETAIVAGTALVVGSTLRDLTGLYPMIVTRASRRGYQRIVYRQLGMVTLILTGLTWGIALWWTPFDFLWFGSCLVLIAVSVVPFIQKRLDWAVLESMGILLGLRIGLQFLVSF